MMNLNNTVGVFLAAGLLAGVHADVVYQDDFTGAAGVATATVPEIPPVGFEQKSFKTGLDGEGRLESSDPLAPTAGYRVKLGGAPLTDDLTLSEILFTVTMRTPTNDWIMIGFQENDFNGLLTTDANTGPVVQFNPGGTVILRGGTYSGGTNGNVSVPFRHIYANSEVITATMTYHIAEQTMDLVINGSVLTNGFALGHEFPVGVSSDPVVCWAQMQLRLQPSAADGGGYIDSLQVVSASSAYAAWAGGWGVDIGAETNDFDGDGLNNLYEYGLGGNPVDAADRGGDFEFETVNVDGTNQFRFVHPQLSRPNNGLNYFVQQNANLVSGLWTGNGCRIEGTNITGGILDFATNSVGMEDEQKYMRLFVAKTGSAEALRASILKGRPLPLICLKGAVHVSVADFGAVPDDGQDDRDAVVAAIEQARSLEGPVQIDFDPGIYDFFATTADFSMSSANAAVPLINCKNLVVDGHDAEILIHRQDVSFVWVWSSENLIVRNFSVDYDPLPFSQGIVQSIDTGNGSFLFGLQSGFPEPNDPFFASCDSWGMLKDASHPGRLKADCPSFFSYSDILAEGSGLFRVVLADAGRISNFEVGDPFVINGRSASIGRYGLSENITFDRITAYACPGSLFVGSRTSQLNVLNCSGQLKGNRLIVSGADGVHCQSARIGPWIENCDFEGLSDDCLNIYGLPVYILEQLSSTQMTVYARAPVLPGDRLVFFDPNAGQVLQDTTVVSFSGNTLTVADPVGALNIAPPGTPIDTRGWKIYDHAYNLDAIGNRFVYRNNTMHDGRRYGMLLKASYGLIENNVFEGLSRTGVVVENNINWPEGFWSQNLVIQNNRISECGYGNADPCALISSLKLTGFMDTPIQKNIYVLNNTFNAVSGPALELSGVSNLTALGNTFTSGSTSGPLITVQYSEDITLTNNVDEGRVEFN
ncbi:right-handed parallel beta-helix repeat-containing protein [Tichowtungia aerotolerans]|uniref:Right handed beta helix domain-containing protein n=1 Tax=Tichowtungia aerotolerans TaxID=2697043 RepID=A0A6P1M5G1_9BACT|nr:right-handed parallel beta-helix repeat-containing protein [Tichowtungia aerotolerans]QHI69820.1 hypothetical protein GT409_10285 [Tichowtungia aerotolerans]